MNSWEIGEGGRFRIDETLEAAIRKIIREELRSTWEMAKENQCSIELLGARIEEHEREIDRRVVQPVGYDGYPIDFPSKLLLKINNLSVTEVVLKEEQ